MSEVTSLDLHWHWGWSSSWFRNVSDRLDRRERYPLSHRLSYYCRHRGSTHPRVLFSGVTLQKFEVERRARDFGPIGKGPH